MKVLMVISQYYPIIGGAEKQAQLLAQKLVERGIEVKVITGWWRFKTPRREIIRGVPIFRNFSFWGVFGIKGLRPLGWLTYMITLSLYLLTHRKEYDLIHVHQVLYPAFISVLIGKRLLNKPVLSKMGCSGLTSDIKSIIKFPFGHFQLKYLIKHLDSVIATNHEGVLEFKAAGYPGVRIQLIPNGVSSLLKKKAKLNGTFNVITTVRLDQQKGIDILLKAWSKVVVHEKTIKLLILGEGPLERELKNMAKSLKIVDSVKFSGFVNNPENYLMKSDIFILPSRAEGMSNALLEAMSVGLPCIATNISGNRELISDGENQSILEGEFIIGQRGILVNPNNVEGLSKSILYLIRDPEKREELGRRARHFIQQNYSIDLIADKYIELYQRLLERKS
jgi:glycosyltransferase involved in cell wall biosynthesis